MYQDIYHDVSLGTRLSISWENIINAEHLNEFLRTGAVDMVSKTTIDKTETDTDTVSE
ncbi:MAG: hypothetical protein H6766_03535 [Candidatus Peribacteria bacterium]|nr:MAG: hypothetical protein H6766_03535 [Candidatus Peribacteria bacterium]